MIVDFIKGNLYSIKIKGFSDKLRGIFLCENKDWIFVLSLFSDYMVDGCQLLRKKYILSISQSIDDIFTQDVLVANEKHKRQTANVCLTKIPTFEYFYDKKIVLGIQTNRADCVNIGYINKISEKSIFMTPLNDRGVWEYAHYYSFRKDYIRIVEFDTDYINSLVNYSKSLTETVLKKDK